jgi:hypothetical protein
MVHDAADDRPENRVRAPTSPTGSTGPRSRTGPRRPGSSTRAPGSSASAALPAQLSQEPLHGRLGIDPGGPDALHDQALKELLASQLVLMLLLSLALGVLAELVGHGTQGLERAGSRHRRSPVTL